MMQELRDACAQVAERARSVRVNADAIPGYASALEGVLPCIRTDDGQPAGREQVAACWLTLDAINFGSGWFPTLRKRDGLSGYNTIASRWRERHESHGPFSAQALTQLDAVTLANILGQDPRHQLIALYAASLNDLGDRIATECDGRFADLIEAAGGSAVALARRLGGWSCFADTSRYDELTVPFLKRAQIAAADLHRGGAATFTDLGALTIFADNLVPHVLRLDGVLDFDADLVKRIEDERLLVHGSREEIEIRACAVHATELIVAELRRRPAAGAVTAAAVDELLWNRGQEPRYKARPRPRCRCTAY